LKGLEIITGNEPTFTGLPMAKRTTSASKKKKPSPLEELDYPVPYINPDDSWDEFHADIFGENDRQVAIAAASALGWRLEQSIKARLCVSDKIADKLLGVNGKRADLDYSHQCRLAYCLGLIGPLGLEDFLKIGEIRNKFGHVQTVRHFTHASVRQKCLELHTPRLMEEKMGSNCPLVEIMQKNKDENVNLRNRFAYTAHSLYVMPFAMLRKFPQKWKKMDTSKLHPLFPYW
jgi:hypothetical protein